MQLVMFLNTNCTRFKEKFYVYDLTIFHLVTAGDETMQEFLKPLTPITEGDNENTVTNRKSQIKTLKQSLTSKTEQANKYSADYSAVPIDRVFLFFLVSKYFSYT